MVRPAGYTGEEEKEDAKHDETPSLRYEIFQLISKFVNYIYL